MEEREKYYFFIYPGHHTRLKYTIAIGTKIMNVKVRKLLNKFWWTLQVAQAGFYFKNKIRMNFEYS
jgi:hypothetical protein